MKVGLASIKSFPILLFFSSEALEGCVELVPPFTSEARWTLVAVATQRIPKAIKN